MRHKQCVIGNILEINKNRNKQFSVVTSCKSDVPITTFYVNGVKNLISFTLLVTSKNHIYYLPEGLESRNWMVKSQQIDP